MKTRIALLERDRRERSRLDPRFRAGRSRHRHRRYTAAGGERLRGARERDHHHRPPPRRGIAGRAAGDRHARRPHDQRDRRVQHAEDPVARAVAAGLFVESAQHRGQHPRHRRAVRPDQRRLRAGRRHLCRRRLLLAPGLGGVRFPRRRPGRSAARAAGHALRQEHHRRRDQHPHQPADFRLRGQRRGQPRQLRLQAGQGRRFGPAVGHHRGAHRGLGDRPPRHDLQCHDRQLDPGAGQPRPARAAAVPAQRRYRHHPRRRLQHAESRMLRHGLRRLRPDRSG